MENFWYSFGWIKTLGAYDFYNLEALEDFESKKYEKKEIFKLLNQVFEKIQTDPSVEVFCFEDKKFLQNFSSLLLETAEILGFDFDFLVQWNKIFLLKSIWSITNFLFPDYTPKTKTLTFLKKVHMAFVREIETWKKLEKVIFSSNYEDFCTERKIFLFYFPQYKKQLFDEIFSNKNIELEL